MSIDVTLGAISHSLTWIRSAARPGKEATLCQRLLNVAAERKGKGWRLVKIDNFMKYAISPLGCRWFRGA